jgi:hypothetical protein
MNHELKQNILQIMPLITRLSAGDTFKVNTQEISLIEKVYKEVNATKRLNVGCADCIKFALTYIETWFNEQIEIENKYKVIDIEPKKIKLKNAKI